MIKDNLKHWIFYIEKDVMGLSASLFVSQESRRDIQWPRAFPELHSLLMCPGFWPLKLTRARIHPVDANLTRVVGVWCLVVDMLVLPKMKIVLGSVRVCSGKPGQLGKPVQP